VIVPSTATTDMAHSTISTASPDMIEFTDAVWAGIPDGGCRRHTGDNAA